MQNRRKTGARYEQIAGRYLECQGYEILEYNYRGKHGEVDIVAKHEGYLVFVEVKYRRNDDKGYPLEAVALAKQRTICKCAVCYIREQHMEQMPVRFDVVGIMGNRIRVIPNAFDFVV